jgi:hypothetical protein
MRNVWRWAPLTAVLWSTTVRGQAPPAAPPELPLAPAPVPTEPAPVTPDTPSPAPLPPEPSESAPLDQGPDTLPSLDEEPAPPLAPPPVAIAVVSQAPRAPRPVRAERRLALLGEWGWNGLAGFGPILVFHAHPQLSLELGLGLALVGAKIGLRARYNFLDGPVTPFVGVGLLGGSGFDAPTRDIASDQNNTELNIKLRPSTFIQSVVGLDWTSRDGFTLVSAVGYAWRVSADNVEIVTGVPTPEERQALDVVFGSSIVISFGIGYSFR